MNFLFSNIIFLYFIHRIKFQVTKKINSKKIKNFKKNA